MSQSQYRKDAVAFHTIHQRPIREMRLGRSHSQTCHCHLCNIVEKQYGHDHHPLTGNRETKYQQFPDLWIFFPKAGPVYVEHSRSASFMIDFAAEFWRNKLIIRLNVFHLDRMQQMLSEFTYWNDTATPILYIWNKVLNPAYWFMLRTQGSRTIESNGTEQWELILQRYPMGISK